MKKRLSLLLVVLICVALLVGCCKHETWIDASCETPKTCAECGEVEGAPAGHRWIDATCETAKTCESCGKTEGEALGHNWAEATCTDAKICQTCGMVEGEALGHNWVEATTEAPKTCTTCNATEGERIITDSRFTSASAAPLVGKWRCTIPLTGDVMGLSDFTGEIPFTLFFDFRRDGNLLISFDLEEFRSALLSYMVGTMYAELEKEGLDKDAADGLVQAIYGMSIEAYCTAALNEMNIEEQFDALDLNMVYYVEGNSFYSAETWSDEMKSISFTLDGDILTLSGSLLDDSPNTVLNRVAE